MATAEKVFQFSALQSSGSSMGFVQLLASMFGCQHRRLSRPFTRQGQTYRSCLGCGARKQFDLHSWETRGDFYHER